MTIKERTASWIPILIENGAQHVHALLYWDWTKPWKADRLPKGVEICGLGPGKDETCELCRHWGAPSDTAPVPRPLEPRREAIGDHREALLSTENEPETTAEQPETKQKGGQTENPSLFNDF